MPKYYKLTDELNSDEIVKDEEGKRFTYQFGTEMWIRNGIMVRYMWPDDIKFGQFVSISEEEANRILGEQRKTYENLLKLAIKVSAKAHEGQVDKGGNPYFLHPQAVATSLDSTEHKIVAYLHDVCEDTDITPGDLENMGFTYRIANSVRILTKADDVSYDEYLASVKKDSNAWHVKRADIKHNLCIERIPNPTEKDFMRLEKYRKALRYLEN